MKRTISKALIGTFFAAAAIAFFSGCTTAPLDYSGEMTVDGSTTFFRGGSLMRVDGIPCISVSGSHYDMGLQYGVLLREDLERVHAEVAKLKEDYKAFLPPILGFLLDPFFVQPIVGKFERRIPEKYREELRGIADGSGIPYSELLFDMAGMGTLEFGCTSMFLKGDDSFVHGRNLDWAPGWLGEYPVVTRYEPEGKRGYVSVGILGYPSGILSGMSDEGISVSVNIASYAKNPDADDIPVYMLIRDILENASTLNDVDGYLMPYRTDVGWLISVGSKNDCEGAIYELAPDAVAKRTTEDSSFLYALNGFADPALNERWTPYLSSVAIASDDRYFRLMRETLPVSRPSFGDLKKILAGTELYGIEGFIGYQSRTHSGTIQMILFDPFEREIIFSSGAGFAGWAKKYVYSFDTGEISVWAEADPIWNDPQLVKYRELNRYFIQDLYCGRAHELYDRIDLTDGILPIEAHSLANILAATDFNLDIEKALGALSVIAERHPEFACYPLESGMILYRADRFAEAIPFLERALDAKIIFDDERLKIWHALALCNSRVGNSERAHECALNYIELAEKLDVSFFAGKMETDWMNSMKTLAGD